MDTVEAKFLKIITKVFIYCILAVFPERFLDKNNDERWEVIQVTNSYVSVSDV
jgi:hypothetical protein